MRRSSFETIKAVEAVAWFEDRWREIDAVESRNELQKYCERWVRPLPMPGVDDDRIVFVQEGERPPPFVKRNVRGSACGGSVTIAGTSLPYKSAQEAMRLVFSELQRRDKGFLPRFGKNPRFRTRERRFVAPSKRDLGTKANQKHAKELGDGWWMSTQTKTREKWNLIEWAADVAKLRLVVVGKYWQAEAKTNVEVGF